MRIDRGKRSRLVPRAVLVLALSAAACTSKESTTGGTSTGTAGGAAGEGAAPGEGVPAGPGATSESGSPGGATAAGTRAVSAAGIAFDVPAAWESSPPTSGMRAAQFRIPADGGDAPELVLFFFGEGQGGGTEANLERWAGQMGATLAQAKTESRSVGELKVTSILVSGTYAGGMGMGGGEAKPGYRMWGAVVEGRGGPWFFKATGPEKAMESAGGAFEAMVSSLRRAG